MDATPVPFPSDWRESLTSLLEAGRLFMEKEAEGDREALRLWTWDKMGLSISSAAKLKAIVQHPILSDPQYRDRLPAQWAKLAKLAMVPDEILLARIADGSVLNMTRTDIALLHNRKSARVLGEASTPALARGGKREKTGARVHPPDGLTVTEWVCRGIALEKSLGIEPPPAAKAIEIYVGTYLKIRPLILLREREDLSEQDRMIVEQAVKAVDRERSLKVPELDVVQAVIAKFWKPGKSGRYLIRVGDKAEVKRKEAFLRAVVIICDTCNNGADVHVPFLSKEEAARAMDKLHTAIGSLRVISRNVWRQANG